MAANAQTGPHRVALYARISDHDGLRTPLLRRVRLPRRPSLTRRTRWPWAPPWHRIRSSLGSRGCQLAGQTMGVVARARVHRPRHHGAACDRGPARRIARCASIWTGGPCRLLSS